MVEMQLIDIFGHDYVGAKQELVAILTIGRDQIDVSYSIGPLTMGLLPPGGYMIGHLEGIIGPIKIRWKSSISTIWTEYDMVFEYNLKYDNNFYIEFTKPHRLSLASDMDKPTKVKIMRFVPQIGAA